MARLLIVEDHPELASLMVAAAESRGHEATAVHTGEAALALLRPAAFHAAVVDLLLPDMRGSAVLSALRDHAIPAVAVSGVFKGDRFAREATEVHGARAFFEKPFELLQLLESVEQLCGLTRPLSSPDVDEEEVVVFEDASLLDMEDEPVFTSQEDEPGYTSHDDEPVFTAQEDEPGYTSHDDEPVFGPPPEEPAPVVQGLVVVEEVQDPLSEEVPAAATEAEAYVPNYIYLDETPPAGSPGEDAVPPEQEPSDLSKTPITLKPEDLEELETMDAPESAEEQPAEAAPSEEHAALESLGSVEEQPVEAAPPEEHAVLEALGPAEEQPAPAAYSEEHAALEALGPAEEQPAPAAYSEEHAALEALGPAEEQPAPAAYTEEHAALEALGPAEEQPAPASYSEEQEALAALGPAEETSAPDTSATDTSETLEPEPGLALPFGEREKVWTKKDPSGPGRRPPPEWSLSGDLKNTSVPRLLNAYYEARHSGELKLRQGSVLKVVYFEAGRPVYATSNLAHERFARVCVRRGVLPEAKLQEVATLAREQNIRSSEAMMRLGLLDARRHPQLIEEQVKEILWSTFSWTEGAYGFSPTRPPRAGLVKLSVFPGDLILEGILRSEPLESLRQRMPRSRRLFPTAAPPYALHELKLKGPQALLLAYADGSKTVEDLLTLTELPERGVLATLRGLELIGVLEERREEPSSRSRISFGL